MTGVVPTKAKLQQLQKQYGADSNIAEAMGVSSRTVLNWRRQRGVPSIYFKNEIRNIDIKKKNAKGWSVQRICRKFGLSASQVYRILRRGR